MFGHRVICFTAAFLYVQRRLLECRSEVAVKETAIANKESTYALLRSRLSRLPDPTANDQLATYQASLKSKNKQLRALEGELVRVGIVISIRSCIVLPIKHLVLRRVSIAHAWRSISASSPE